jgi:hypothetical protein
MRRWLPLLILIAAAVPAAPAENPEPAPPPAERVQQLQRNYKLIEALVHGGLRLAEEGDALKRAEQCNGVAERLAHEIWQAAECRESARVTELGEHLCALLQYGVAVNLNLARKRIANNSNLAKSLEQISQRSAQLIQPLEEQLLRAGDPADKQEVEQVLRALQDGRTEVEKAAREQADAGR